jgi:hypothetical protein
MQFHCALLRGLLLAFIAVGAWPVECQNIRLSPRDLFLEGERRSDVPLSVRYGLLRRHKEGAFSGVDPSSTVFYAGDRVRIRIQPNQNAFLVLLQRGSSGAWSVLYPREGVPTASLAAFETCDIPGAPGAFVFDDRPGEERIVVIISREQISSQSIVDRMNSDQPLSLKEELKARALSYEKVDQDRRSSFDGTTVYVSNTATGSDPPLLIHLKLQHKGGSAP